MYFVLRSKDFVCLFVLRLNIPVNNFSVMSGWSHRFLGITSTFRGVKCLALESDTLPQSHHAPRFRLSYKICFELMFLLVTHGDCTHVDFQKSG